VPNPQLILGSFLASRRAFTPESSPPTSPPTSRPTTPNLFTLPGQGTHVLKLTAPIPETPQCPTRPISPLQRNAPATYKEGVGIHTLRHVVRLSLRRISALVNKLVTIVSYIANYPTTSPKRPDVSFFGTPERERLVAYIQTNTETGRMTIG
jgi:hypothetical protein